MILIFIPHPPSHVSASMIFWTSLIRSTERKMDPYMRREEGRREGGGGKRESGREGEREGGREEDEEALVLLR